MRTVLPHLKAPDWPGRDEVVCRPLAALPGVPWVALAYPMGGFAGYVGTARLEKLDQTHEEVEARALANLAERPLSWRHLTARGSDGNLLDVLAVEDEYAAERILDPAAMKRLQDEGLKAESLAVGVPFRGILVASAAAAALASDTVATMVRGLYERAPHEDREALIGGLFAVRDGAILGRFKLGAGDDLERPPDTNPYGPH